MEASKDSSAWLPLTPRGVAAFATASLGRLLLVQLLAAGLTAAAVVWVLDTCWFPAVAAGIEHLPEQAMIRSGRLDWTNDTPKLLAESRFIAFAVDLAHTGQARSPSQVQVEFGQTNVRMYSVFGCAEIPYPRSYSLAFNMPELKPWWGAWAPILLALAAGAVVLGLLLSWAALATLYCLAAWLVALYFDRQLTLRGSWLLAAAALMPGSLVMTAAILFYGMARLDLVRLTAAWVFHLVLGWVYLISSATAAPKVATEPSLKANPFKSETTKAAEQPSADETKEKTNPFRTGSD